MLSARAYSFRQKSRLAISLSWIGGFTNAVMLIAFLVPVSHMSGNTTLIARHAVEQHRVALLYAFLVLMFLVGGVLSALMTEGARVRGRTSKYVLPMTAEALLLMVLAFCLVWTRAHQPAHTEITFTPSLWWLTGLASLAMGLQNATITKISGAEIRTTHVTGVITDLGLESVQLFYWWMGKLRGRRWARAGRVLRISQRHPTALRLLLLASIFGSFVLGAVIGTLLFDRFGGRCLLLPIVFLLWIVFTDWRTPIADVKELDLLSDPELRAYGMIKELLPPELGIYRITGPQGHAHRPPNFQLWIEHIPRRWKVVILAIHPQTRFTSNAVLDLRAAAQSLRERGCRLVISGVTPHHYREIDSLGVTRWIEAEDLCPDLEFAIARAMTHVHRLDHGHPLKR